MSLKELLDQTHYASASDYNMQVVVRMPDDEKAVYAVSGVVWNGKDQQFEVVVA